MKRCCTIALIILVGALSVTACSNLRLPQEQDVVKVFTTADRHAGLEPEAPTNIPVLAVSEMEDWHSLCNQCHRGPNYSSYTILQWGHLDSCLTISCHECHSQSLHMTRLRGDKANCYECHIKQNAPTTCQTCHGEGCWPEAVEHDRRFLDGHGKETQWKDMDCLVCHGSSNWCLNCHGVPMPHAADILDTHPSLVRGQPEMCNKCHGEKACETCHNTRGIVPNLEEYLRTRGAPAP